MIKVNSVKHDKIWGYEIWLYSPVAGMETTLEDGTKCSGGPLLKILKADQNLSVQVHPDDKWAQELENQENGKSESWMVLKGTKADAKLIMGIKNFDEDLIRSKLADGSLEEELIKVDAKIGSFYNIPAGLIHGVGAGCVVFEMQQPSDVTYRYFDYNRLQDGKPRELHVDKALKVQKDLTYKLEPISKDPLAFDTDAGIQKFYDKPTTLEEKSIVVNLETYECFIADKGEAINWNYFVVVPFK